MPQFPKLTDKALLAPMTGVTDVAFRVIARKCGAALTCTEFVNASAVVRGNKKTFRLLERDKSDKPCAVQIFGNDVKEIVKAAKILEDRFDIVELNCGCADRKVTKIGAGSELLKRPEKIGDIVVKASSSITKPFAVKIRTGIRDTSNAVKIAKIIEESGAAAITVHGRTQRQGYSKPADWNVIKTIKESVEIPVIGNGDVFSPEQFKQRLDESGVDYISIARGAIGNPLIFRQINDYLKKGKYKKENNLKLFFEYLKLAEKYELPFTSIKHQAIYFTKGAREAVDTRKLLVRSKTVEEMEEIMRNLLR